MKVKGVVVGQKRATASSGYFMLVGEEYVEVEVEFVPAAESLRPGELRFVVAGKDAGQYAIGARLVLEVSAEKP